MRGYGGFIMLNVQDVIETDSRKLLQMLALERCARASVHHLIEAFDMAQWGELDIRFDNGPKLAAAAVKEWLGNLSVNTGFIEPGSPWENGCDESFNSKLRDELLDGEVFYSLKEAQILIAAWQRHHNTDH